MTGTITHTSLTRLLSLAAEAAAEADALARHAAEADYTQSDLRSAGLSRRDAQNLAPLMGTAQSVVETGTPAAEMPRSEDVVTVVPASETPGALARKMLDECGAYARDHALKVQVPQRASWLAMSEDGALTRLHPIAARFFVPSPAVDIPQISAPDVIQRLAALLQAPTYGQHFPGPASVFLLGSAIPLAEPLPLGIPGGRGVRGLASYSFTELVNASSLREARTINQA